MKRILSIILAVLITLSCVSFTAFAQSDIGIVIDGQYQTYDVMPVIEDSRTLVPMRGIFETLGAVVNWDEETRTVMAAKGDTVIILQIGNKNAWVNGEAKELDVPGKIINDRTMVPIRFVAEALGCKVEWDEAQRSVFVYSTYENNENTLQTENKIYDASQDENGNYGICKFCGTNNPGITKEVYDECQFVTCEKCQHYIVYQGEDEEHNCQYCGMMFYTSDSILAGNGRLYCPYCNGATESDVDEPIQMQCIHCNEYFYTNTIIHDSESFALCPYCKNRL